MFKSSQQSLLTVVFEIKGHGYTINWCIVNVIRRLPCHICVKIDRVLALVTTVPCCHVLTVATFGISFCLNLVRLLRYLVLHPLFLHNVECSLFIFIDKTFSFILRQY